MKRIAAPTAVIAIALIAWVLVPGPFAHGVIVGIVAVLGALLGGLLVFGKILEKRRGSKELVPPPLPTATWDYSMPLTNLDGQPISFADDRGRVIVLNFWATWCPPCIAELPSLERLRSQTDDLDVRFGFITTEDPAAVRKFLEKRPSDPPIYILSGKPPECFSGRGIPATFVLDRTGMIALRHFGAAAWDNERVVAFVRGLAAMPSVAA